jgi:hypothetical protein
VPVTPEAPRASHSLEKMKKAAPLQRGLSTAPSAEPQQPRQDPAPIATAPVKPPAQEAVAAPDRGAPAPESAPPAIASAPPRPAPPARELREPIAEPRAAAAPEAKPALPPQAKPTPLPAAKPLPSPQVKSAPSTEMGEAPSGMLARPQSAPKPAPKRAVPSSPTALPGASAAPETAEPLPPLAAAQTIVDISRHVAELEKAAPGAWLERVRLLRREGRVREAETLLTEFRKRYPNEAMPGDLQ